MTLTVDTKQLDEFCLSLFRTLDGLGLLPLHLWAKPTEFEKYPRLLFGSIQRYNDVEAGFSEWESRVLRDTPYRREQQYPSLQALRQWVTQHTDILGKKTNTQHLRTSLYARMFQYVYPRRVLANAYCVRHQGDAGALDADVIERDMPRSIEADVLKLRQAYGDAWETITADTRACLVANAAYYRTTLVGKTPVAAPEPLLATEQEHEEELG